jgi:uncharacterized membrane protein YfcA
VTLAFGATLAGLGLLGAFVAGLLGVGGAIVMIPLLLYVPPALHVGALDMKAVAGVTMAQVCVAAFSGMLAHHRHRAVNADLAWIGGISMAVASLAGAFASAWVRARLLLFAFALMVTAAGVVVLTVRRTAEIPLFAEHVEFSRGRTVVVALAVGVAAGLVGAGGAFLLVPLLITVVGIPVRVAIGSSLAITAVSAVTGLMGKAATGQVPWAPALAVAVGAVPGANLGAAVSRRLPAAQLRLVLGALIVATGLRVWWDLLFE